jgi:hypothetical protein
MDTVDVVAEERREPAEHLSLALRMWHVAVLEPMWPAVAGAGEMGRTYRIAGPSLQYADVEEEVAKCAVVWHMPEESVAELEPSIAAPGRWRVAGAVEFAVFVRVAGTFASALVVEGSDTVVAQTVVAEVAAV